MPPQFLLFTIAIVITSSLNLQAAEKTTLLFQDDFQRSESQESTDEPGNGWGTNSAKRAGGNKQVDLIDGKLHVFRHKDADHAVSLVHPAEYRDCRVELEFKFDDAQDDLGIDFADMECEDVHAGHICKVFFRHQEIEIQDLKEGRMNQTFREALQAGKATEEQKAFVRRCQKKFPFRIELGKWHRAVVVLRGNELTIELDGRPCAEFSSPGIGHPQKDMIRFSARREVHLDNIKMAAISPDSAFGPAKDSSDGIVANSAVNHLFAAKLLLRKMEPLGLTDKQLKSFNQMSHDLRLQIDKMREEAGITKDMIKRRDEVYSQLKKSELKGDALWNELQRRGKFTDRQRDAFRQTLERNKAFRKKAIGLLTEEQLAEMKSIDKAN